MAAQALKALNEIGRAVGEIAHHSISVTQNVFLSPDYWRSRTAIIRALKDFPEARLAVLKALSETEGAGGEPLALSPPQVNGHAVIDSV